MDHTVIPKGRGHLAGNPRAILKASDAISVQVSKKGTFEPAQMEKQRD